MVYCSGLESHCQKPQETAENAQFSHKTGAPGALFTEGSAACVGTEVGTLTESDWDWVQFVGCVGIFDSDKFEAFLVKTGYRSGRRPLPKILADHHIDAIRKGWFRKDSEWTYFARGRLSGLIKIGKSKHPDFRVGSLKHDRLHSEPADMLVKVRGGELERAYHNAFHTWRFIGEWFAPHPDILAEIERLAQEARND